MKISVVVPCYNEEDIIREFYEETVGVLKGLDQYDYEIILIDDGSQDDTLKILKELKDRDAHIRIISFSRNFGKESGIYAGLESSNGDLVVVMDGDLQHPPKLIPEMVKYIEEGFDTVTTIRKSRKGESFTKSIFSRMFYKIMERFDGVNIKQGSQDFRMMKRQVVDSILSIKEYNRFSKGIFSWVGFNVKYIEIENIERKKGKSKWKFKNLFNYAVEGIVSFTTAPLKLSIFFGLIISFISIVSAIAIIIQTVVFGKDVPGYASIITSVLFMGGIQTLFIGILSEYISKMYFEIKDRPKYIVKEKLD